MSISSFSSILWLILLANELGDTVLLPPRADHRQSPISVQHESAYRVIPPAVMHIDKWGHKSLILRTVERV